MRGIQDLTGYKGTVPVQVPGPAGMAATKAGQVQGLLSASFATPGTYTAMFAVAADSVLAVPTPSQGAPPVITQPTGSASGVRVLGIVTWKTGGIQIRRLLDLGSGVSISGNAESCDIQVQDISNTVGGNGGQQYRVSASLVHGVRPSTSLPPTLWEQNIMLLHGNSQIIQVPQDAGVVSVEVVAVDTTAVGTVPNFITVSVFTNGTVTKFYCPAQVPGFVKLAPGAQFITIANQSGADNAEVTIQWGIDG